MVFQAKGLKAKQRTIPETLSATPPRNLRSMLERASRLPEPPKDGEEPERDFRELLPILALGGLAGNAFQRRSSGSTSKTCFACLTTSK